MKLEERRLVDQLLVSEEPCLGAVLCSYTFDPAYFEDHVLRALLRLRGDPEEDGARFHEEARAALRDTPVACFVDASVRRGGRRLPYDLLLVRRRTFHPKVVLALYESEARLAIGSGNVTKPGLEQNTELFFVRHLRYDEPAHAALLRDVDGFLASCASLATSPGTQLALVRQALTARILATRPPRGDDGSDVLFASTFGGRLVDRLGEILPADARITRASVLAPFFEQDDLAAADDADGMSSVLGDLLALRGAKGATLDIGVPWDDAPLGAPPRQSHRRSTRTRALSGPTGSGRARATGPASTWSTSSSSASPRSGSRRGTPPASPAVSTASPSKAPSPRAGSGPSPAPRSTRRSGSWRSSPRSTRCASGCIPRRSSRRPVELAGARCTPSCSLSRSPGGAEHRRTPSPDRRTPRAQLSAATWTGAATSRPACCSASTAR